MLLCFACFALEVQSLLHLGTEQFALLLACQAPASVSAVATCKKACVGAGDGPWLSCCTCLVGVWPRVFNPLRVSGGGGGGGSYDIIRNAARCFGKLLGAARRPRRLRARRHLERSRSCWERLPQHISALATRCQEFPEALNTDMWQRPLMPIVCS